MDGAGERVDGLPVRTRGRHDVSRNRPCGGSHRIRPGGAVPSEGSRRMGTPAAETRRISLVPLCGARAAACRLATRCAVRGRGVPDPSRRGAGDVPAARAVVAAARRTVRVAQVHRVVSRGPLDRAAMPPRPGVAGDRRRGRRTVGGAEAVGVRRVAAEGVRSGVRRLARFGPLFSGGGLGADRACDGARRCPAGPVPGAISRTGRPASGCRVARDPQEPATGRQDQARGRSIEGGGGPRARARTPGTLRPRRRGGGACGGGGADRPRCRGARRSSAPDRAVVRERT